MKCLILAAGYGSRLRGIADSKPLAPVGGIPLIEHVIERAAAGGADGFVVVTGHGGDRLEAVLAQLEAERGFRIECVRCDDWDRPNGYSVLAGADALDGDFLLTMSDHLFDPAIVRRLLNLGGERAAVTLAVDRKLAGDLLDIDDATKVETDAAGRILRIGKKIERYNAIDTGVFRATPALAVAIRADIAAGGSGSLSEGVQRLADAGQARVMEVGTAHWIDVDSPAMLALAEELVKAR